MSTPTPITDAAEARDGFAVVPTSSGSGARTRRRVTLVVASIVVVWSTAELVGLITRHTIGPELYGVLVAFLGVVASVLGLALIASNRRRPLATTAVLILWTVVALGGIAGTVAHAVGPGSGHGVVDPRPRPVEAPLVFTVLGLLGGSAVYLGRARSARERKA